MFESLKSGIQRTLQLIKGQGKITESNISEVANEIRRTLIQSDVNATLATELTEKIKEEAIGKKIITSLNPEQVFTKIVNDRLVELISCGDNNLNFVTPCTIIMIVGLQGAGKTTFSAKLAAYTKEQKRKPLLIGADVYRPAAMEQLSILAKENGIVCYVKNEGKNVIEIIRGGIALGKEQKHDVIIIDTAGRQTINDDMMKEISSINSTFNINERLLVLDSTIGQTSVAIAQKFNESVNIDGYVLTKLDGDAHGGAALSITAVTKKPIKFLSTGERVGDIELFHPDRIINRILGKGDVVSLVEKVEREFEKGEKEKYEENIKKGYFDYEDLLYFQKKLNNMGGIMKLLEFLPAFRGINDTKKQEGAAKLKKFATVINSMTPKERKNMCRFDLSRKGRIAKGAGVNLIDVEETIAAYEKMKKLIPALMNNNFPGIF